MPSITIRRPHLYAWGMGPTRSLGWLGAQAMPLALAQAPAICLGPTDANGQENQVDCSDPTCTYGDCGSTAPAASGPLCLGPTINGQENQIDCSDPNCTYGDCISAPAVPATGAATAAGQPGAAAIPTGTQLTYNATIAASLTASTNQATILSYINGDLSPQGLQVTSSNFTTTGLTTFNVSLGLTVTGKGFNQTSDIKAIVDGAFYQQMGHLPMSSNITVGGPGGMQNWAAMLEGNLPWILLGLAAVVVLPAVVKKL